MKKKFTVSVVVPAYNAGKTIESCLKALTHQTVAPVEILIVDDCSKDNTVEIVKKWSHQNKIVKLITQPKNQGPAKARNLGAQHARGDIIVFTDSDCTPFSTFVEQMIQPFTNPEVVGVQGAYETKQTSWTARFCQLEIEDRYDLLTESMKKRHKIDFIGSYAAAYKRSVFLSEKGFDTSFPIASGEDSELSYRLEKKGYLLVFNPNAKTYHLHPDQWLHYFKSKVNRAKWRNLLYKKNPEKMAKDSYTPLSLKIQIPLTALGLFLTVVGIVGTITHLDFFWFTSLLFLGILMIIVSILLGWRLLLKNMAKDFWIGVLTPFFVFLRTIAFLKGMIEGAFIWFQK